LPHWCRSQAGRDLIIIHTPNINTITEPPTLHAVPPAFSSGEQPRETVARESGSERDPTNGGEHSKRHGRGYRKSRSEKPAPRARSS
jgi:hypothetical protein